MVKTEIFCDGVNFEYLVKDAVTRGWAFADDVLTRGFSQEVLTELRSGRFESFSGNQKVYERFERLPGLAYPSSEWPLVTELGDATGVRVRVAAGRWRELRDWVPNEVSAQRYFGREQRIGRHRDYMSDKLLIVVYTLQGCARLRLFGDRYQGEAFQTLETSPGSLLLLRAPGLGKEDDNRLTHSVGRALGGPRISLGYRYSLRRRLRS